MTSPQPPKVEPPPELKPFVEQVLHWARELLEKGERVPSVYVIGRIYGGVIAQVVIDTSSDATRDESVHQAKTIAAMEKADFVIMVTEAWTLGPKDSLRVDAIRDRYGSISAYPGRIDALAIQLESHFGHFGVSFPIRPKPPSKKRRTLGHADWLKPDHVEGRLAGILAGGASEHTVH